jgi:hypothetical protein
MKRTQERSSFVFSFMVAVMYPEGELTLHLAPQYHTEKRGEKTVETERNKENAGKVVFMLSVLRRL